jgi:hypothetical protein
MWLSIWLLYHCNHNYINKAKALTAMRMMGELEWKPWVEQPNHAWRHAQLLVVDAIMKVMAYCVMIAYWSFG